MRRLIIAMLAVGALLGAWIGLLLNKPPRDVPVPMAAATGDPIIGEYLRHRSEGHLVRRYQ